jgi:hypothetical protein
MTTPPPHLHCPEDLVGEVVLSSSQHSAPGVGVLFRFCPGHHFVDYNLTTRILARHLTL